VIELVDVGFRYAQGGADAGVSGINLRVRSGEVVVLTGGSGCGKTTLTKLINGLIPHVHEGEVSGLLRVAGRPVADVPLADAADVVGSVFQNPRSQFFTVDVGSELAFAAENLGHDRERIVGRVTEAAGRLGLGALLDRSIFELSGGQKQKVACGSVWVSRPQVLVLDEPSSNLDGATIDELRSLILAWKDAGCAVVVAEHRLHYLQGVADRWLLMEAGRIVEEFAAADMAAMTAAEAGTRGLRTPQRPASTAFGDTAEPADQVALTGFQRTYPGAPAPALDIDRLVLPRHGVVAVTGPNGAGKSTLIRALVGLDRKAGGVLELDGRTLDRRARLACSYLVMQDVNHQLFAESVAEEITLSAPDADAGRVAAILAGLDLTDVADRHPMSLSGGQKQRTAIATAVASGARVVVFDEPTSGLDRRHMSEVAERISELVADGRLVVVVTHDEELIAACATHLVQLADGRVVASGPLAR
jgi:energy-coupling factor transport system ATP-binding protein